MLPANSAISQGPNENDKGGFSDNKSGSYNDFDSYVNMVQDHNNRMNRLVSFGTKGPNPRFVNVMKNKQQQ